GQYDWLSGLGVANAASLNNWESLGGNVARLVILAVFQGHINVSKAAGTVYWKICQNHELS
ncbi:hypothetical protein PENNAL_c0043G06836, partial [Penicillium nalgiovense]